MALNPAQKKFVSEMAKHGDENKAVLAAYPHLKGDKKRIRTYWGRLMNNEEVSTKVKEQAKKVEEMATQQAADQLANEIKTTVLSASRKRQLLMEIAEGKLEIPVKKPVWVPALKKFVTVPMTELPDHNARMKAIELDNKMSGDTVPDELVVTVTYDEVQEDDE